MSNAQRVVPIAPQRITQRALAKYARLRNQLEALKQELSNTTESLKYALSIGTEVEEGSRVAVLVQTERRSVSWKDVVIRLKSEGYARRIIARTKPVVGYRLVVK